MGIAEQLDLAIAAHAKWKTRLREAIDTGRSDWSVERLRSDTDCAFGHWLESLLLSERFTERFQKIRAMHREFHTEAARVLAMALSGQKQEADAALGFGSVFAGISASLVIELEAWREDAAKS